jgi:ribosomal protein S9
VPIAATMGVVKLTVSGPGVEGRRKQCARAIETALSNMEAELRPHLPDVCYVHLTAVAARRPDDDEGTHGGDGTA